MLAVIGWIIFRAESITQAWEYMCGMCDASLFSVPWLKIREFYIPLFTSIILMLVIEWNNRDKQKSLYLHKNTYIRWLIFEILIGAMLVYGGSSSEFIYFQF